MHPVFLKIGPISIRYYGLMYAIAFVVGIFLAKHEAKRRNIDVKLIEDYAVIAMLSGLIGGRLYYVILDWAFYSKHLSEIPAVWHGGMAIHGGIIGGIIGTIIFAKVKKVKIPVLFDISALTIILGQAIGRIGNLMNGDANGVPTIIPLKYMLNNKFMIWWHQYLKGLHTHVKALVPWGITFPLSSPAGEQFGLVPTHPTMIYEMILNFVAFLLLWFVFRKKKFAAGTLGGIYLIMYAFIRTIVTVFRADDLMLFGVRAPFVANFIMVIVGILTIVFFNRKRVSKK